MSVPSRRTRVARLVVRFGSVVRRFDRHRFRPERFRPARSGHSGPLPNGFWDFNRDILCKIHTSQTAPNFSLRTALVVFGCLRNIRRARPVRPSRPLRARLVSPLSAVALAGAWWAPRGYGGEPSVSVFQGSVRPPLRNSVRWSRSGWFWEVWEPTEEDMSQEP